MAVRGSYFVFLIRAVYVHVAVESVAAVARVFAFLEPAQAHNPRGYQVFLLLFRSLLRNQPLRGTSPEHRVYGGVRADFPVAGLVNLKTRTAPDAPSGRAADYARSGEMNNRERYNLHVSGPKKIEAHFNVVEARPEKDYSIWIIAACSAGATILIIAAALIFLWDSDDSGAAPRERGEPLPSLSYNAPEKPAETSVAAQASAADKKASLYEVMDAVKVKIEGGDFEEALALWDGSAFSKKDAKYREEILGDIGYRIDSLLRYADNVFILEAPGETEMSRAIRNVSLARRGLDIDGVPRKEERMAKWETLNKKIKK